MRKFLSVFLTGIIILSLLGCSSKSLDPADTHKFHYRRAAFQFGTENAVVASESRDISGHAGDWSYLITLYLSGPLDEELVSPFPESTRLLSVERKDTELFITLTDSGTVVLESEFSLACVCLTLTCLETPEISQVTIQNRDRSITLTRENMILYDAPQHQIISEDTQ